MVSATLQDTLLLVNVLAVPVLLAVAVLAIVCCFGRQLTAGDSDATLASKGRAERLKAEKEAYKKILREKYQDKLLAAATGEPIPVDIPIHIPKRNQVQPKHQHQQHQQQQQHEQHHSEQFQQQVQLQEMQLHEMQLQEMQLQEMQLQLQMRQKQQLQGLQLLKPNMGGLRTNDGTMPTTPIGITPRHSSNARIAQRRHKLQPQPGRKFPAGSGSNLPSAKLAESKSQEDPYIPNDYELLATYEEIGNV